MIDRLRRADTALVALCLVLITTSILRFTVGWARPFWLDEVQTGMLVMQPTLADFIRQCSHDVNAPLYYILAFLWAQLSGLSDHALRFLPAALGVAAPLLALAPRKLIDRPTRFTWCALLACWIPGIFLSQEARWYTLALFLGVANAVAFASVMRSPSQRAAWLWTIVSSLLILAHYYGVMVVGLQGLVYLAVHKRRAIATWPAALVFAPAAASIAVQASALIAFTTPATAWIHLLRPIDVLDDASFIFGVQLVLAGTLLWLAAVMFVWLRTRSTAGKDGAEPRDILWLVPACSLAATLFAIGLGFFKPVLIARYFIEFVPAIFLGLALCADRLAHRWELAGASLVAVFAAATALWATGSHLDENAFNFEIASRALMADHPRRLVFLWDSPMTRQHGAEPDLGGFFFKRAGRPVSVDSVGVPDGADPNTLLLARAAPRGSAILWIYDLGVRGTAAIRFPPRLQELDPRWRCRNFGTGALGVIGCDRAGT